MNLQRFSRWLAVVVVSCSGSVAVADDWSQWMGPQRDGVWRETGIIEKFPESGPKVLWRVPIGGGYAGPAVVGDRVYVTDKQFVGDARNPDDPFARGSINAVERVLCLDAQTGGILWKHEYPCPYTVSYPAGPRTTPNVDEGRVYTLGAEGDLLCLDADTGKVIWQKNVRDDYGHKQSPVWGFSSNPLIDGDKLIIYVGGKGSTVVAFNKHDGKELWKSLDSTTEHGPGYGSPVIIEAGGVRQLIVWHPSALSSVDPETGKEYWSEPFSINYGMSIVTPRKQDDLLYVSAFYNGSLMMRLDKDQPKATVAWKRVGKNERQTEALHCVMSTPVLAGDYIYGVGSYGELRALNINNGDRIWATYEPTSGRSARWGNAFLTKQGETGDRYVLFSEQGDLIFSRLTPEKYEEISRAHLLDPTGPAQRRDVVWVYPAYANRCVYVRNDKEMVCVSLAAE